MSRSLVEAPLTTRNARARLAPGVHWRGLDPDTHLGYRKGVRTGGWLVRWRVGKGYLQAKLKAADDTIEADGDLTLNFHQATSAARAFIEAQRAKDKAAADGVAPTVRSAINKYVASRERRTHDTGDARSRLGRHVLTATLADVELHKLSERHLKDWRGGLPDAMAATTVRRLANDLKAALRAEANLGADKLPASLPLTITKGLKVSGRSQPVARDGQILTDADVRRLIEATWEVDAAGSWDGDLGRIVLVLAATGARFSQIARLTVADVQPAQKRLMIPSSNKGHEDKPRSPIGVPIGEDVLAGLRPAVAGRRGPEKLLERWRHKQIEATRWERVGRGPWLTASELQRPWKLIVARAELGADITPYALRHSSIVRGLRCGLPIRLVAGLHDTSSSMIEAHYSAFIVSALEALAAQSVIPLFTPPPTVTVLARRA